MLTAKTQTQQRRSRNLSRRALALIAVCAAVLALAGCEPPTGEPMSEITITAGFPAGQGADCAPGGSGSVQITVTPTNLDGSQGISTAVADTVFLPLNSQESGTDADGLPAFRCETSRTFFNLRPGVWKVQVDGAAGSAWCGALAHDGRPITVTAGRGGCVADDGRALTVATANFYNGGTLGSQDWPKRVDRFTGTFAKLGLAPDAISLTETAGWWQCRTEHAED